MLFVGTSCRSLEPRTRVMVYNLSADAFSIEGHRYVLSCGQSGSVYAAHGSVDTLDMTRSTVFAHLVITSLVQAGDPNEYDAAVNVHQDSAGVLYCLEFSPYIDAEITGP
jgi:hypothetical protein